MSRPGGRLADEAVADFVGRQDLVQFQLDDLLAADDAQRQRQGEDQARLGVEALRCERKGSSARRSMRSKLRIRS